MKRAAWLFAISLISAVVLLCPTEVFSQPTSVTIAGSLQSEVGCSGDWQPDCATTHLAYDAGDDVWQGSFALPAGNYEYKAAINNAWDENYGLNAAPGGANIPLNVATPMSVKFYYDHKSHWVTSNLNSVIATVPGSFQSELGCAGDWDPSCLRSWLQDADGDGIYTFSTTAIPAGSYEAKVAINESWDLNYGQGGAQNGANIPFNVTIAGTVTFSWDSNTHILTIQTPQAGPDNNVQWDGLRHDSRDALYRSPGGAVPAGTKVKIRFRTFHDDVTEVLLRLYDVNAGAERFESMQIVASNVPCYQDGIGNTPCDYWEAEVTSPVPNNYWYRFVVTDGSKTAYYADNTPALDGGVGSPSDNIVDNSYALMFYDPAFKSPTWARDAVIYQIFPDRFRNGRHNNDAHTGDVRYDDPVLALPWGTLPEGYCRAYTDAATNCPWRFDSTPPDWSPTIEGARSRDYFGGDLKGVDHKLDYLKELGINTIYFNPIFDSASNHGYDTQDYTKIDPYFGNQQDWSNLEDHASKRNVRLILDGVFNHLSSDSQFFDRYHHFFLPGACESATSAFRDWFHFRQPVGSEPSPCVASTPGGTDTYYDGWFGFDSIPVINKSNPIVQWYFLTSPLSISRYWLYQGASGWRLDVMGDSSFPSGYWETFRQVVKQTKPNALIIGELWQKDSTLLRFLRGDRADATMNYRLRDAVIGLLASDPFDAKGFADSGHQLKPSEFAARLEAIREDYSDATYYSLMNLLDSHDTARLLWVLTPGQNNRTDKEWNAANVAIGKRRVQLASLLQFAVPGSPTVYYGDEVGVTGNDDPDDRRTYPWEDEGGTPDYNLRDHYRGLISARNQVPALRGGDFRTLVADDTNETVAIGRKTGTQAALVLVNRSSQTRTISVPLAGYIHDGVAFKALFGVGNPTGGVFTSGGGEIQVALEPESGLLLASGNVDLTPPAAPSGLRVTNEASHQVSLSWNSVTDAAGYNVYRSFVSGGGWQKNNTSLVSGTNFTVTGLADATLYYFVVKAVDAAGNESTASNEVSGIPHLIIGWANLQWPPTLTHTISTVNRTDNIYGQIWIDGVTNLPGPTAGLRAQVGFGPNGSSPAGNPAWTWVDSTFNVQAGNNDEYVGSLLPDATGTFDYVYRYSTTNGRDWLYADLSGPVTGSVPGNPGKLTVNSSGDTTAPDTPTGLVVTSSNLSAISLSWNAISGDATLYGYEVLRSGTNGGPYTKIATTTAANYTDKSVSANVVYYYVVRAVDLSFNRSGFSSQVSAKAEARTVTLNFNVTVPATTDGTGRAVYIAGFLDRLDGGLPQWNPGGVSLTRVDATHWTITLTGKENTQIEYKYTLGDFEHVEKDASCGEIANRALTLTYGSNGNQLVNDLVPNWRNVSPCGN
jgi:glycosidase/fibronectin type 3 domain-containing protein